jgi:hypothetical protein
MKKYYDLLSSYDVFNKLSALELRDIITNCQIPALARRAAVRLYGLGERDFALEFLINQMNQYNIPSTSKNIIRETCPEAAKELGRLKDDRAVEFLFSALGELGFGPAYGLAKYNSPDIEHRLASISKNESKEAIYSAVALGYMKNIQIIPRLVQLINNYKKYEQKINDMWVFRLRHEILCILGSYSGNSIAINTFYKHLASNDIDYILNKYLHQNNNPSLRWLEWEIVTSYNWSSYVDNEEKKFCFRYLHIDQWKKYSSLPCPFNSMTDITNIRAQIVNDILRDTVINKTS